MSRGVRVLSRLQIPPETLARFAPSRETRTSPPDVVFYTGCNVLKTPHIALLCLDILDLLGVDYEVMGGVGQCCGVYQYRGGDFVANNKVAYATIDGLASAGASTVLSWCPSCQISIGEVSLPNYELQFGNKPFDLNPFLTFLAAHADRLAALMKRRVEKRVALHERPVFPEVMAAVKKLLSIIPGAELVEIDVPRVGTQANSLAQLPKYKRELVQRELAAVADAGVTTLATIYHACHREICDAGEGRSFEIVNFMELLGEGLGLDSEDSLQAPQADRRHRPDHRRDRADDRGAPARSRHGARRAAGRIRREGGLSGPMTGRGRGRTIFGCRGSRARCVRGWPACRYASMPSGASASRIACTIVCGAADAAGLPRALDAERVARGRQLRRA